MTRLRKMMLEELQRRNYSQSTTTTCIRTVEDFARYFKRRPDQLGPEHIREYQAQLFSKRKLAPNTVTQRLAALRFFFVKTLNKPWSANETPSDLEHIREYQAQLFSKRKLAPNTVTQRLAALRFFFVKTLNKPWSANETPYPKK